MILNLTIVGLDLDDYVRIAVMKHRQYINRVNSVKYGRLGNFRTLTYMIDIRDDKSVETRRNILKDLSKPDGPTVGMYEHGNSEQVYIFRRTAFKQDDEIE